MALTNNQKAVVVDRVLTLLYDLPSDRQNIIEQLVDDATAFAEGYTNRTSIPDGLLTTVGDIAIWKYNRLGTEGESSRSEGGESYSFESLPQSICEILNLYRLIRIGGKAYEKAETH